MVLLILVSSACNSSNANGPATADQDNESTREYSLYVKLTANFSPIDQALTKFSPQIALYTPKEYRVGLKSAVLIGGENTSDVVLFEKSNLMESIPFNFKQSGIDSTSLIPPDVSIPEGLYLAVRFELYYLQMKIAVRLDDEAHTSVDRNIRIYFSDDAEVESGPHQPGDVTHINANNQEVGWMFGSDTEDFTGVSPRESAYKDEDGNWVSFAAGSAQFFGPFGDATFWNKANKPIYSFVRPFNFTMPSEGGTIIVTFRVADCWACDDRNGDGYFNPSDIGGSWHMSFPGISVALQ